MPASGFALVALAVGSCGGGSDEPSLPPRPTVVNVALSEYRFRYKAPTSPGRVVFRARNEGERKHEILLLPLPEDFPPIRDQVRGKTRRPVGTLAFLTPLRPGGKGVFAVDVRPGRYAMVCFVETSDGISHARKGMTSEFRVR